VNAVDSSRMTPLYYACVNHSEELVKVLREHGADPDIADVDGMSSRHYCEDEGYSELLGLLNE